MEPHFSELAKVRVTSPESASYDGYVIGSQFRDGRWIYKISITDDLKGVTSWDNWVPEEWLEKTRGSPTAMDQ